MTGSDGRQTRVAEGEARLSHLWGGSGDELGKGSKVQEGEERTSGRSQMARRSVELERRDRQDRGWGQMGGSQARTSRGS